jgi:hypoxanthine phosphoribosyltransferase
MPKGMETNALGTNATGSGNVRRVITAEQLQKRVKEMGRQISDDYHGKSLYVLAILENGFVFMADLIRSLEVPTVCQFLKPRYQHKGNGESALEEIFFSDELELRGQHVLLIEGVLHSGVTTEFLMSNLRGRGVASVKLATLLDRQAARRVALQPDYFGYLVDEHFFVGYGMASPQQEHRNLPYVGAWHESLP